MEELLYELPDNSFCVINGEEENISVEKLLKEIPDRLRQVIIQCFGLDGKNSRKLHEISDAIGVSKERVRQLREEGLTKLRELLVKD